MAGSPYAPILRGFQKHEVNFVVIGVSGINYYANEPARMFLTQDFDILVEPKPKNLFGALQTLEKEEYRLESNGEPVVGVDLELCEKIIQNQAVISAKKGEVYAVDIVLDAGRIPFKEWRKSAQKFIVDGIPAWIGDLSLLIRAKENSNREKDRAFLSLYKIQLKEMLQGADPKGKKKD